MGEDERGRKIHIPVSDDLILSGALHLPGAGAMAGVVICHGMLSTKDSEKHTRLATELCRIGIAALRFDFQGCGQSPGDLMELSFSRQVAQARAAVETLRQLATVQIVGLAGSSMGATVAILLAADDSDISCLVTMAGVARTQLLAQRIVGQQAMVVWERKGWLRIDKDRVGWSLVQDGRIVDVPAAAGQVRCPWLIIHGEKDEIVPIRDATLLCDSACSSPKLKIVDEADHRFSNDNHRKHVVEMAVGFFDASFRRM